ncbi:hypothetical protein [Kitasatospora sp. NPDC005856]|uniref:hypothetical protein n=1 Tax=Kitasatospora sp. NPDC005856 TaxID=3154566 RepID=UPI003407A74D
MQYEDALGADRLERNSGMIGAPDQVEEGLLMGTLTTMGVAVVTAVVTTLVTSR